MTGSLQTVEELYRGVRFWPAVPQFQNYVTAWTSGGFGVFIPNSLLYSVVAVSGILLAGSMAGYALARIEFPGRAAIMFVILISSMTPEV
jgi:ABC-type glycerol-3-phosphate transport system permease component